MQITWQERDAVWVALKADPTYQQLLTDAEPIMKIFDEAIGQAAIDEAEYNWETYRLKIDKFEDDFFINYYQKK